MEFAPSGVGQGFNCVFSIAQDMKLLSRSWTLMYSSWYCWDNSVNNTSLGAFNLLLSFFFPPVFSFSYGSGKTFSFGIFMLSCEHVILLSYSGVQTGADGLTSEPWLPCLCNGEHLLYVGAVIGSFPLIFFLLICGHLRFRIWVFLCFCL